MIDGVGGLDLTEFRVSDDADDDPVLLRVDGTPVDTWRQGYPYDKRMDPDDYQRVKRLMKIELFKLQEWIKDTDVHVDRVRHPPGEALVSRSPRMSSTPLRHPPGRSRPAVEIVRD